MSDALVRMLVSAPWERPVNPPPVDVLERFVAATASGGVLLEPPSFKRPWWRWWTTRREKNKLHVWWITQVSGLMKDRALLSVSVLAYDRVVGELLPAARHGVAFCRMECGASWEKTVGEAGKMVARSHGRLS